MDERVPDGITKVERPIPVGYWDLARGFNDDGEPVVVVGLRPHDGQEWPWGGDEPLQWGVGGEDLRMMIRNLLLVAREMFPVPEP